MSGAPTARLRRLLRQHAEATDTPENDLVAEELDVLDAQVDRLRRKVVHLEVHNEEFKRQVAEADELIAALERQAERTS